jgi:hypothetical protein
LRASRRLIAEHWRRLHDEAFELDSLQAGN